MDCDGTLAPIVDTPCGAAIPQKVREALIVLLRMPWVKVAVISGRSLRDIKALIGVEGIIYAGNHGLEIEGPGISFKCATPPGYAKSLAEIRKRLADECAAMPGILLEDKGLTLGLHYRMADVSEADLKSVFHRVTSSYESSGVVKTAYGKKVFEVRPGVDWDKGSAVNWLIGRERSLAKGEGIAAVYIGDDRTDEDAFRALGKSGITVRVGQDPSSLAEYYLDDTEQVYQVLTMIIGLKKG